MDLKSITWVFFKQLIILGIETLLEVGIVVGIVFLIVDSGICTRADYDAHVLMENQSEILNCEESQIASYLPKYSTYRLYDEEGNVLSSTMTDKQVKYMELYEQNKRTDSRNLFYYYSRPEGTLVIRLSYVAHYNNEFLYYHLPDFEYTAIAFAIIIFVALLLFRAHRIKKLLIKELKPLLTEIENINNSTLLDEDNEDIVLSSITEISEVQQVLKRIKKELADSLRTQWRYEQRRKENMSALAHDIKTPLTVINGNMDLMLEDVEDVKALLPENKKYLVEDIEDLSQGIFRNSNRIQGYVSLLMDESRKVNLENYSANTFSSEIKSQIEELCNSKSLPVQIDFIEADVRNTINIDIQRTQRAIMNIVRNAIEYTNSELGIIVRSAIVDDKLAFSIKDFGKGFSEIALLHYAEQFYTEDKARGGEHYGLGLFFAKQVAAECGGDITVVNTESGAEVTISIKLQ